tara:strand:- start:311 stop:472 length:162 start_codon:yes stop_codon:yes gene_type:complete
LIFPPSDNSNPTTNSIIIFIALLIEIFLKIAAKEYQQLIKKKIANKKKIAENV